jgi:hypothetical protein
MSTSSPATEPGTDEADPRKVWAAVRHEHESITTLEASDSAAYVARSAEGTSLYGGLDSHVGNGHIRELVNGSITKLSERVEAEERASAEADGEGSTEGGPESETGPAA